MLLGGLWIVVGTTVALGKVCSPQTCISGSSDSPLLAYDRGQLTYLTPGTYVAPTPLSNYDLSLLYPKSSATPANITSLHIGSSLVVVPPPKALLFSESKYKGDVTEDPTAWKSGYFPDGFYGLVEPGKAVWGAVPDVKQLRGASTTLRRVGLTTCDPPCASGGICKLDYGKAVCACNEGWAGSSCGVCAKGFFGKNCTPCTPVCSICDDGLDGTGKCLGTSTTPLQTCDCAHGSCTASGECLCAAGYASHSTSGGRRCSECAAGFYKDIHENCLACPLGCVTCSLRDGTADEPKCTSCIASLALSSASPATCEPSGACGTGQYFDAVSGSCRSCSPACASCTGPSTTECLACASPRINLDGGCVGFEPSTGVCDSSLSGLQGVFVVNDAKSRCDACPAGCTSCIIPSFSSGTAYSSATCRTCQDGYLLENDRCVKTCSEGWFLPEGSAASNGTCQRCDESCTSCIGSATTCTKCPPPTFASGGACISLCPSNTAPSNGTCLACSPDCSTCSSPTTCLTCRPDRPVLLNGRCVDFCPRDQFFDGSSCLRCDSSCGSCLGPSPSDCSTCPEGSMLNAGKCVTAECQNGLVPGLSICLESFVAASFDERYLGFLALVAVLVAIGYGGWWYIRRQRRRTREATREFADALDEREVGDRMMILRLEKVLGLDRMRPQPALTPRLAEAGEQKARERKRLRDLLVVVRRKREGGEGFGKVQGSEEIRMEQRVRTTSTVPAVSKGIGSEKKVGWADQRESHGFAPPPPYALANEASASSSSIASSALHSDAGNAPLPPLQTKIVSMSSPTSPDHDLRALRPPPRRTETSSSFGPNVKVPLGQGESDGKELDRRRSLKKLWPVMPSPVFGQAGARSDRNAEAWL